VTTPRRVEAELPRQRGRYIPAAFGAIRRVVFLRDQQRCTCVDDRGQRCRETRRLEFHHLDPFARSGVCSADNVTLRCRPHHRLTVEQDFGKALMSKRSDGFVHEAVHGISVVRDASASECNS